MREVRGPAGQRRTVAFKMAALATAAVTGSMLVVSLPANADPEVTRADVEKAFHEAEAANEKVNELKEEAGTLRREIRSIKTDLTKVSRQWRAQRDAVGADIVAQRMDQPLGPTAALFSSADSDQFLTDLATIHAVNTTRAESLEKFNRTSRELEARRKRLADQRAQLTTAQRDAEKNRDKLRESYRKAKADLSRLDAAERAQMNESDTEAVPNAGSGASKTAIAFAMSQLGDPYVYGGTGPDGWDCSGLVLKAYAAAGVSLPRVVGPQMAAGKRISRDQLAPGDLVAYPSMSHIGIYLGNGRVIHAPRPGKSVEITSLNTGFGVFARVA